MHICRTRFNKDIIAEFAVPANRNSRKVLIFCPGMPSAPYKDDILEFWAQKGYWAFFPRYRGSWESNGIFLEQSPHLDILSVIDELSRPFIDFWNGQKYRFKPEKINIVGSSFGGPAAILASMDPRVNKVICMSPVVDWKAEEKADPLDNLYKLTQSAYGDAYRLNKTYWNKLKRGRFYNPAHHLKDIDGRKILIYHAKDDDVVKIKPVIKFAAQTGSQITILNKGGHLSSSLLMTFRYYLKTARFLKS